MFRFDKSRSRAKFCPCGKNNRDGKFAPFVEYNDKGYCHSCATSFFPISTHQIISTSPTDDFKQNRVKQEQEALKNNINSSFSLDQFFSESLATSAPNNFILYLRALFGNELARQLTNKYLIGTSDHWNGATIFWQIDALKRIKAGKVMLYDLATGKRVKEPFPHITWVHTMRNAQNYQLRQCLFGEHLLKGDLKKPIAIVESEKTAIICSVFFPELIWLATGGFSNLTKDKFLFLTGRRILIFPDLNCCQHWAKKVSEIRTLLSGDFLVSNFLEQHATQEEKDHGYDLADFLIIRDEKFGWALSQNRYPLFWDPL